MVDRMKKYFWIWCPIAIVVVAVAVIAAVLLQPSGGEPAINAAITPTLLSTDGSGAVEPDSAFLLTGSARMEDAELREQLRLEPDLAYGLRRDTATGAAGDWLLVPAKPLPAGESVKVSMGISSATFNVAKTLLVTGGAPANGSSGMNVRSGLELKFNADDIPSTKLREAITVSPEFEYEIAYGNGKFSIFPKNDLSYATDYTLTVKKPLASQSGLTLRDDFTLSFSTISEAGERAGGLFALGKERATFNTLTDEVPVLEMFFDQSVTEGGSMPELEVTIYRFGDAEQYKTALTYNQSSSLYNKGAEENPLTAILPTLSDSIHSTFTAQPALLGESGRRTPALLTFPETLPEGYYLAELSYTSPEKEKDGSNYVAKRYKLMQSSDMSVFFMQTGEDLLLWVNDAATGNPIEGASFVMEGDLATNLVVTQADGTALISDPELTVESSYDSSGMFTIKWGEHTYVDARFFQSGFYDGDLNQSYISTMFTDRPLYQTTDTVQVWGMVRPRRDDGKPLPEFKLELNGIDPVVVEPDEKGLFTATLKLEDLSLNGYGRLELTADGKELSVMSLRIYDYIKPVYTATITPDKPLYMTSSPDMPVIKINVTMFDGTPVPNFNGKLEWQYNSSAEVFGNNGNFVTDEKGDATVSVISLPTDESTWYPRQYPIAMRSTSAEEENFISSSYINVIHRDLMLLGKVEFKGDKADLKLTANRVDTTKVLGSSDLWQDTEKILKGAPVATQLQAKLISISYEKTQIGVSYDYINRVSVPSYTYDRVEKTEQTFDVTTAADGSYTFNDLPCYTEDKDYRIEVSGNDSAGRPVENTFWLTTDRDYPSDSGGYRYSLDRVVDTTKMTPDEDGQVQYGQYYYKSRFTDGETATFTLSKNDQPTAVGGGRVLHATVQKKIENVHVTDSDTVSIPFAEELLPNYTLTGAYFDGKHIFALEETGMRFDPAQRELSIAYATAKTDYAPGEEVSVDLTVTEKLSGKPAANADVVLAVVDEAIFAIREQNLNPLGDIYQSVFYPTINKYVSFNAPDYPGAGEMGGGGGDENIREKFPDTALFTTLVTDANGKAQTKLTLPDSVTSWRITSVALTQDNRTGTDKTNINATMDFFVTPMRSEELLEGDDFMVGLRSAGKSVTTTDAVSYTVTVEGNGIKSTQEVSTNGIREYGWAAFKGLAAGDYSVTVSGSCKGYTDGVKLPFSVIKSGIEVSRVKTVNLNDGLAIDTLRYPVTLSVYDKQYALYNQVLWAARDASYGQRTDMRIGRAYTDKLLNKGSQEGSLYNSEPNIGSLNYSTLMLFPTDEQEDMRLTALAYMSFPEVFVRNNYWVDGEPNPNDAFELAAPGAFYMMKAVAGLFEPGSEVNAQSYSFVDKLDLAVAYALAGNVSEAQKVYAELVTPNIKKLTGVSGAQGYSLPASGDCTAQDCTAAASRLATVLGHADADGFMRHLLERPSRYDPYIMEKLLYLRYKGDAAVANPARISYSMNGERIEKTLDSSVTTFWLTASQLAALDMKVLSGDALADVCYTATPLDADPANKKLTLTKTVTPVNSDSFKLGDLVKITITPDVSAFSRGMGDSELIVDDYLPSAMKFERYEQPPYLTGKVVWELVTRDNQRLRFSTYADSGSMDVITYYARGAMPGTYMLEGAYISSGAGDMWGASERGSVEIVP